MRHEEGRRNVFYIHVTLLPFISATGELKTKPTQHSVRELRSIGIQPDAIICRSDDPVEQSLKDKIALFCDVQPEAVIPLMTVPNIYQVPLILEEAGLGDILAEGLDLSNRTGDLSEWADLVRGMEEPKETMSIAVVGKYVELPDSYISVKESLKHAALFHDRQVDIQWIHSEEVEREGPDALLKAASGIVVPGGFGPRGVEGMIQTARYARENGIPYLGLCLGLQVMVADYARHVLGWEDANSTEFDPDSSYPVIDIMPEQESIVDMGGTMRLGKYPCRLVSGTIAHDAYAVAEVDERHRHRFEVNNRYRDRLEEAGLVASGISPDRVLVEISEVRGHPFMVGVQFHPEFRSRPNRPHPLFRAFMGVAKDTMREGAQPPLISAEVPGGE
jgi:CTP synthase